MTTRRWALAAMLVLACAPSVLAQESAVTFTINPAMTRGPATALVTIVEFSDYQ